MSPVRLLLFVISWLYARVMDARNIAFDLGMLKTTDVGIPVISIGNISVGGTGKTPLVEFVARYCLSKKKRVAIVSRGYKRESKGVVVVSDGSSVLVDAVKGGDEPVQMARKCLPAAVVVGERRVDAAEAARAKLGAEAIILDDGFQHRSLHRGLDIVVIDSQSHLLAGLGFPTGFHRESWKGLRRAGLLALSNVEQEDTAARHTVRSWKGRLSHWHNGPMFAYRYRMSDLRRAADLAVVDARMVQPKPAFAFSGIGNHEGFVRSLRDGGFQVVGQRRFADHHRYSKEDMEKILREMRQLHADVCLTTEKDVVRLIAHGKSGEEFFTTAALYYPAVEVDVVEGEAILREMIDRCLEGNR